MRGGTRPDRPARERAAPTAEGPAFPGPRLPVLAWPSSVMSPSPRLPVRAGPNHPGSAAVPGFSPLTAASPKARAGTPAESQNPVTAEPGGPHVPDPGDSRCDGHRPRPFWWGRKTLCQPPGKTAQPVRPCCRSSDPCRHRPARGPDPARPGSSGEGKGNVGGRPIVSRWVESPPGCSGRKAGPDVESERCTHERGGHVVVARRGELDAVDVAKAAAGAGAARGRRRRCCGSWS